MEIKEEHYLLQPLIPTSITKTIDDTAFSYTNIAWRFMLIFFITIISIWASYEASKGFEIITINEVSDTPSGRKFHLFFVSNDEVARIVLNTSNSAEKVLYPDDPLLKKSVSRVTIRLTNENHTRQVAVHTSLKHATHEYVICISSSVMEESNVENAMVLAIQRGMSRIWLWNGENSAPNALIEGMVEYINLVAGLVPLPSPDYRLEQFQIVSNMCWIYWDDMEIAHFLRYCEMVENGFIARLNQAMQLSWHDEMVDGALGVPTQELCGSYYSSMYHNTINKESD